MKKQQKQEVVPFQLEVQQNPKRKRTSVQAANEWTSKDKLELLFAYAGDGLNMQEIALQIGISRSTLYKWIDKFPILLETIEKGRDASVEIIENALFQNALNGNVTAQIFYLKNKRPEKWKDRRETTLEVKTEKIELVIE